MEEPPPSQNHSPPPAPLYLHQLGALVNLRITAWPGQTPDPPEPLRGARAAPAHDRRFLIDPRIVRRWRRIAEEARANLRASGWYFRPLEAYFVPWPILLEVRERLLTWKAEFERTVAAFLRASLGHRIDWLLGRLELLSAIYPEAAELAARFTFEWLVFPVPAWRGLRDAGALSTAALDDLEGDLLEQCRAFAVEAARDNRWELAAYCDRLRLALAKPAAVRVLLDEAAAWWRTWNLFEDQAAEKRLTRLAREAAKTVLTEQKGEVALAQARRKFRQRCFAAAAALRNAARFEAFTQTLRARISLV